MSKQSKRKNKQQDHSANEIKIHRYKIGSNNEKKAMRKMKKHLAINPYAIRHLQRDLKHMELNGRACCFLAAVLGYVVAEVIETAGETAMSEKKKIIKPRHIMKALRCDEELNTLMVEGGVIIPWAGVRENIHPQLLVEKKKKEVEKMEVDE